jgi:hypothetical protein
VSEARSIAFEFRPFRVLERPFAPKKHCFAARRSIPAWDLRKIEMYPNAAFSDVVLNATGSPVRSSEFPYNA